MIYQSNGLEMISFDFYSREYQLAESNFEN
jgi:hypothetical protein